MSNKSNTTGKRSEGALTNKKGESQKPKQKVQTV
jgi:hypothetical protein